MEEMYQKLKETYQAKKVTNEKDLDFVASSFLSYAKGLSQLTKIEATYFIEVMQQLDFIRFLDQSNMENSIDEIPNCHRSISFERKEEIGIYIDDDRRKYQEDGLFREMINICIQYEKDQTGKIKNRNLEFRKDSRLYEGILETISQRTWKILKPGEESIGEAEDRYFMEVQIADTLIDAMGKKEFLESIFLNPNLILEKMRKTTYQGESLLNYLDHQMSPLIPYHGEYKESHMKSIDLLNSFEAVCDCSDYLILESRKNNDFKSKVG